MCRGSKPVSEFAWRRIKLGQHDSYCRQCRSVYKKRHYRKNKARYAAQAAESKGRIKTLRTEWLLDYFMLHPCVDCGESDPVVLELDHLGDKRFDINYALYHRSWSDFLAEIAKCEVVCVNCHRRRTASRGGWARLAFLDANDEPESGRGESNPRH